MVHSESPVRLRDPEMELYNSWQTFRVLGSLQGMDISRNSNIDTYVLYVRLRLLYMCTDAMYVCTIAVGSMLYVFIIACSYVSMYPFWSSMGTVMYAYPYTHMHICTGAHMHTHTCAHTHTHACTHARTHAHTHTHTHTHTHVCKGIHMYYMYTNIVTVVYQVQLQLYMKCTYA